MSLSSINYFRIVLVGASAANLSFLKKWAKKSLAGVELIFINRSAEVYYTGALSSYLNGSLTKEQIKIDLLVFSQLLGIEFIQDQAVRLDPAQKKLFLKNSSPLSYDLIFIGLGGKIAEKPELTAYQNLVRPYPADNLVAFWEKFKAGLGKKSEDDSLKGQGFAVDSLSQAGQEAEQLEPENLILSQKFGRKTRDQEKRPTKKEAQQQKNFSAEGARTDKEKGAGVFPHNGAEARIEQGSEQLADLVQAPAPLRLAVYGGSIVSLELILNLAQGLEKNDLKKKGLEKKTLEKKKRLLDPPPELFLINPYPELLSYGKKLSRWALAKLKIRKITYLQHKIVSSTQDQVVFEDGQRLALDFLIDCYKFQAESLAGLGVPADFYSTDNFQRSWIDPSVFITSTASQNQAWQRKEPASGVQSVRKGENLYQNLIRLSQNKPLRPYKGIFFPLSILNTGDGRGLLIKRGWWLSLGGLRLKNWIDFRYLASFRPENKMYRAMAKPMEGKAYTTAINSHLQKAFGPREREGGIYADPPAKEHRFCQGCASKVSALSLEQALPEEISTGSLEDAAFFDFHGQKAAASLDFFPSYLKDPEAMAEVVFHHSVNDLVAKNVRPEFFQSLIVLPYAEKKWHGEMLERAFAGFKKAASSYQAKLIGGHSSTGHELMLGVDFLGRCLRPLLKKNAAAGDLVFLTKPLGSGVVLRALMLGQTSFAEYQSVFSSQKTSHQPLFELWEEFQVQAATDVSGFGFFGHLGTLLRENALDAVLELKQFRFFAGALRLSRAGLRTSLFSDNLRYALSLMQISHQQKKIDLSLGLETTKQSEAWAKLALLFEAETSGPILFLVKPELKDQFAELSLRYSLPLQQLGRLQSQQGAEPEVRLEDGDQT